MELYVTPDTIGKKTKEWLKKIAPYNKHKMNLNKDKSALLVIDMQKFFLNPNSPTFTQGGLAIIPNLKRLIKAFRENNRPVIFTCHIHHPDKIDLGIMEWWWKGICIEGSEESKIHNEILNKPEEKVVYKHRYSAFYNTDLETVLRCMEIKDIVIAGIMTNLCCESTARDAYFRDYRVFFLADGTGTVNEEMHLASLMNLAFGFAFVTTVDNIINEIK